ncbi:MAG: FIST C-terminal domain-containing protein [Geobacteraceae bacterium]|nr:FIST C-terminal domain-containing protein [Geobacteraceae bacterium]
MTRIGIGCGNNRNSFELGSHVARTALQSGGMERADLLIAFCSGTGDLEQYYAGLRSVVGDSTPIIGGSSMGVICPGFFSYNGYPAAAAALQSDSIRFAISSAGGVDIDEAAAMTRMLDNLGLSIDDKALLMFYDSVRSAPGAASPPVLNSSTPMLDRFEKTLAGRVPVFGAGLLGDLGFNTTGQFCGLQVDTQHVVGCMLSGDFTAYHTIMHGCIPLDGVYHTITRLAGDIIYELDGRPVVQMIDDLFGGPEWQDERPVINNLTIGINHGDRFALPDEQNYVNRLITGVVQNGLGIGLFEKDLEVGQEIQFMVRDNRMMIKSIHENIPEIINRIAADGRKALFALYISCGGRTAEIALTEGEEGLEVQKVLNEAGVPFLGFYTGVEIAPMLGRSRGLDWTGVLLILTEDI